MEKIDLIFRSNFLLLGMEHKVATLILVSWLSRPFAARLEVGGSFPGWVQAQPSTRESCCRKIDSYVIYGHLRHVNGR